jgi:hypothetical protein
MTQPAPLIYACGTCHGLLAVRVCKTNKNGNVGKQYVSCHKKHSLGSYCSYYLWLDGSTGSPPSTPNLSSPTPSPTAASTSPSAPALALAQPPARMQSPAPAQPPARTQSPALTQPPAPAQPPTQVRLVLRLPAPSLAPPTTSSQSASCAKTGCKSKRLHPRCVRRMCRRHCMDAGGCQAKGHEAATAPTSTADERVISPSPSSSPSLSPPPEPFSASSSTTADMFANL